MDKRIPPDKLCISCQEQEIAPWSDYYCAKCDEDPFDRRLKKSCEFCHSPLDSSQHYYCKKRRGLI